MSNSMFLISVTHSDSSKFKPLCSYLNRNPVQFHIVTYGISLKITYLSIFRQDHVLLFSAMGLSWPKWFATANLVLEVVH